MTVVGEVSLLIKQIAPLESLEGYKFKVSDKIRSFEKITTLTVL